MLGIAIFRLNVNSAAKNTCCFPSNVHPTAKIMVLWMNNNFTFKNVLAFYQVLNFTGKVAGSRVGWGSMAQLQQTSG